MKYQLFSNHRNPPDVAVIRLADRQPSVLICLITHHSLLFNGFNWFVISKQAIN